MAHSTVQISRGRTEKGLASDLNLDAGSCAFKKNERNPKQFFAGSALAFADDRLPLVVRPDARTHGVHRDERIRIDSPKPG